MLSRNRSERPEDLRQVAALLARYTEVEAPEFGEPIVPSSRFEQSDSAPSERLSVRFDTEADPLAETSTPATRVIGESAATDEADPAETQSALVRRKTGPDSRVTRTASRGWRYAVVALVMGAAGAGWWLWPKPTSGLAAEQTEHSTEPAALESSGDGEQAVAAGEDELGPDVGPAEAGSVANAVEGARAPTRDVPTRPAAQPPKTQPPTPVRPAGAAPKPKPAATASQATPARATPTAEPTAPPESLGGVVDELPF